jgi:hypothetical protein
LVVVPYYDLEAMVDAAIMVEDKNKASCESRKRRMMSQGGPSSQRSRSMPHLGLRHPHTGSRHKPQGPTTLTANTQATVLQAETSQEVTVTLSTPTTAAKEVAAIPMVSQGTSLRSVP